ncbi:MAG: bifunctional glutamine-synthetase adenylyltransferase/deadenyltransferase, partial [Bifidobacteriaceae bacterium]|nr:bifunctional glutamine-synthetase adenylyltransferase/deadenyltransferase [Bifidobacteriaceae bacterium]
MSAGLPDETDRRRRSLAARLARLGFADARRAESLIGELAADGLDLAGSAQPSGGAARSGRPGAAPEDALDILASGASPDQALLALARLAPGAGPRLGPFLADRAALRRLAAVLGHSVALGDHLVRHPESLEALRGPDSAIERPEGQVRAALLRAVGADPEAAAPVAGGGDVAVVDALRVAYRGRLLEIAAHDLASEEPKALFGMVGGALADLATGTLEAALAIGRAQTADHAAARLAVIGMGKCGGRELNYVSDVDVIYVAEAADGVAEDHALAVATALASALARVCTMTAGEPAIWQVDANLRPEGKNGPLVRTAASHRAYLERWAATWEFQALLKARAVAGDLPLGEEYVAMTRPMVWACVEREGFVDDAQAMRRRVESHVPAGEAERQIKLGRGGLRDVEFTVQLLQLVHGRGDPSIRSANTLEGLAALAGASYVGRVHAGRL